MNEDKMDRILSLKVINKNNSSQDEIALSIEESKEPIYVSKGDSFRCISKEEAHFLDINKHKFIVSFEKEYEKEYEQYKTKEVNSFSSSYSSSNIYSSSNFNDNHNDNNNNNNNNSSSSAQNFGICGYGLSLI